MPQGWQSRLEQYLVGTIRLLSNDDRRRKDWLKGLRTRVRYERDNSSNLDCNIWGPSNFKKAVLNDL